MVQAETPRSIIFDNGVLACGEVLQSLVGDIGKEALHCGVIVDHLGKLATDARLEVRSDSRCEGILPFE